MVLIREALEGVIAPEVATAILFEALAQSPAPPSGLHEARSFVTGPLTEAVRRRARSSDVTGITRLLQDTLDAAIHRDGLDVEIEVDLAASSPGVDETQQMSTIERPVPVVIVAAGPVFAERLRLCLGEDRVYTTTVSSSSALRKVLFAQLPMIVVVDGSSPGDLDAESLAEVLRGFPDSVVPVLWSGETAWGERLLALAPRGGTRGAPIVTIERSAGIEPLCDLVLSRFRSA
jgi:hypothetical protein